MSPRTLYVLGICLLAACSGRVELSTESTSQATENDALDACYARCKTRASAANCQPGGVSESYCKSGCDSIVPGLLETCQKKAIAAYDCEANTAWACVGNGVPEPVDGGCGTENAALAPCFESH